MSNFYVATRPACGCVAGVVPDDPDQRKHTAKTVANWIRCGLRVNWGEYPQGITPRPVPCKHEAIQFALQFDEG